MVDGKRERNPKVSFSESSETSTRKETIAKRKKEKTGKQISKRIRRGGGEGDAHRQNKLVRCMAANKSPRPTRDKRKRKEEKFGGRLEKR